MQMIERVPSLRPDTVHVSLAFEGQKMFLGNREIVHENPARFTAEFGMTFLEEGYRDVEPGSVMLVRETRLS